MAGEGMINSSSQSCESGGGWPGVGYRNLVLLWTGISTATIGGNDSRAFVFSSFWLSDIRSKSPAEKEAQEKFIMVDCASIVR